MTLFDAYDQISHANDYQPPFIHPKTYTIIKTKRKNLSCGACRKSHLACDGDRPCSRCVKKCKPDACIDAIKKFETCPTPDECENVARVDAVGFSMAVGVNGVMSVTPQPQLSAKNIGNFWNESYQAISDSQTPAADPYSNTLPFHAQEANPAFSIYPHYNSITPHLIVTDTRQIILDTSYSHSDSIVSTSTLYDTTDSNRVCYSSQFAMDLAVTSSNTISDAEYQELFEGWIEKHAPGEQCSQSQHDVCGNCPFNK